MSICLEAMLFKEGSIFRTITALNLKFCYFSEKISSGPSFVSKDDIFHREDPAGALLLKEGSQEDQVKEVRRQVMNLWTPPSP